MADSFKYKLGTLVRDKITLYEGLIIGRTEWIYSCKRYILQAQGIRDGKAMLDITVDEDSMEMMAPSAEDFVPGEFLYELGSEARDRLTGYEGKITGRTNWLYGVNRYEVQAAKLKEDGSPYPARGVTELGLELVVAAPPHKMRETGGPTAQPSRPESPTR